MSGGTSTRKTGSGKAGAGENGRGENGHGDERDFAELLKEINETTRVFHPPANFDPRYANPELLARFGIPPKPDRLTRPGEYAFWWRFFSPPLRFVTAPPRFVFLLAPGIRFNQLTSLRAGGTRYETSSNWSGGYITPKDDRVFTEIRGSWQVPTPSPPGQPPADGDYHCSTWIGLDGQRLYHNSSLPQIGTVQSVAVVNGQANPPVASSWWQWWERGHLNPPVALPLAVKPGDLMMAELIVVNPTLVRFLIKNQTTGDFFPPFEKPPPTSTVPLTVSGATVEWITERPKRLDRDELYRLPDYGTVLFSNCGAVAARTSGAARLDQTLPGAKLINMFEIREQPHRIADISVAERQGDEEVATFFR
ncbi:MAG TPA: G1 family glutamic endopeptidase [Stellaceae bacterium]|jgi:hypothetical protein|nr:G1 family glutamic endopeptidase [Stellaceae bacterium]